MTVSTARHHADWLSLVEVSGPFVSLSVLLKIFPQGLEPRDPAQAKALRTAYDEWQDNPTAPGRHRAWLLHVLSALLGYPSGLIAEGQTLPAGLEANMAEMGETLRPEFALVGPSGTETSGRAHLLIASYPAEQALDRPVIGKHWKANPATRMMEMLHAAGVTLGLVTNGEHWMLVFAPRGETTGYASWYGALWLDEPITLRAFHSLLGVRRFFGVAADSTLLGLLKESAQDQQEVTDQLGYQVREAVEVLLQAFDTLDQDSKRTLLKGVSEAVLYEAALTVMMRLVFLFSAEERGLLHLGKPLYDDNYAVSTLLEQLQEVADLYGPQVLERRSDAWARLLATFRAVHAGVHHQDLLIPAYGGSLFDPDRFPFLEGRGTGTNWAATQGEPLAVNNRVTLRLLTSLQELCIKVPGGGPAAARRVSFRALGVEQIDHVYEGLLDHTAVRATETVLGIKGTKDRETETPLTALESKLTEGQGKLIDWLNDKTGCSDSALTRAMDENSPYDDHRLLIACGHDTGLLQRIRPFAGLIRGDSFERPAIVLPGSVYVTVGTARRSTGTHYTPPSLTEPIVQYTLEPLVYKGPAEGLPREQWQLKPPKELLAFKVCDMAMGSGAFLVQACRYLAERLTEAWENEEKKHPNEILATPEGAFSKGAPGERLVPQDAAERLTIARRIVADRCLYGVDINPMAVEMAKLSLWLITLDAKRPFTFLDHAFKCGDSLLGLSAFKQLENFSLRPEGGKQMAFSTMNLWRHIDEATNKREALEAMPSDTPEQIAAKVLLYAEAEEAVAKVKAAADVLVGVELKGVNGKAYEEAREFAADHMMGHWAQGLEGLRRYAEEQLGGRKVMHWPLAFPEIMGRGGFDAFIGNPPFLGGKQISSLFSDEYWKYCRMLFDGVSGNMNYVGLFLRRAATLLAPEFGTAGFIAAKGIAEGDTREGTLVPLIKSGHVIYWAKTILPWPGTADVFVSALCFANVPLPYATLNGKPVSRISTRLQAEEEFQPFVLHSKTVTNFNGMKLGGEGFILDLNDPDCPRVEQSIIKKFFRSSSVFSAAAVESAIYVVDFEDWPEERAKEYPDAYNWLLHHVRDYRMSSNRLSWRRYWWRHAEVRPGLRKAMQDKAAVLVIGGIATYHRVQRCPVGLFDHNLVIVPDDSFETFAVLQSNIHESWAGKLSSSLTDGGGYRPSDCLVTFPLPNSSGQLARIGEEFFLARESLLAEYGSLNSVYSQFHDPNAMGSDVCKLRELMRTLDQQVVASYDWKGLDLGHGFYGTKQGLRYTIPEAVRREVLDQLLALNHQRHAEEEVQDARPAAREKPTATRGRNPRADGVQAMPELFALDKDKK